MRNRILLLAAILLVPADAHAQNLLSPNPGLIVWTLVAFAVLFTVLAKFAFPPMVAAVRAREQALEEAIAAAARDREAATELLAEQRRQLDASRAEADRFMAEARVAAEKVRSAMIEETRQQQQEMLDSARREIGNEKNRAINELRREAVDLALAGASKVIERNLDNDSNRKIVETYLGSLAATAGR
jgi:F-type H+-transporting ATPase subunit b